MDFEILGLLIFPKVVTEMQQVFSRKGRLFDRLKENSPYRTPGILGYVLVVKIAKQLLKKFLCVFKRKIRVHEFHFHKYFRSLKVSGFRQSFSIFFDLLDSFES